MNLAPVKTLNVKFISIFFRILHSSLTILLLLSSQSQAACQKIVLTGPPGAGKTSIIEKLKLLNLPVLPETFTELHTQAEKEGRLTEFFSDGTALRHALITFQHEQEKICNTLSGPLFVDRGQIDMLAFGEILKQTISPEDRLLAESTLYDRVYFIEPLPEDLYQQTSARRETYAQSLLTRQSLLAEYERVLTLQGKRTQDTLILVPVLKSQNRSAESSITQRTQFILDSIEPLLVGFHPLQLLNVLNYFSFQPSDEMGSATEILKKKLPLTPEQPLEQLFFGVHQNKQTQLKLPAFREAVYSRIFPSHAPKKRDLLQLVGSSKAFNPEGTRYARKFLWPRFEAATLIEYGYTGSRKKDEKDQEILDVNAFVNEYVNEDPRRNQKVLANIVGHTYSALSSWSSSVSPHIKNFVAVYNDFSLFQKPQYEDGNKTSGFTTFGDDVFMSDEIMDAKKGDRLICLEGGAQSFRQVVTLLKKDVPIELVYNLRYAQDHFFSTAEFLLQVAQAMKENTSKNEGESLSPEQVWEVYRAYEKTIPALWDLSRSDAKTKKALFESAISEFIDGRVYLKLPGLCTFFDSLNPAETPITFK